MSAQAGRTAIALYHIAPMYCRAGARSATRTGVVGVLLAPGGVHSIEEWELSLSNRCAPSPRRAARALSALSLFMPHV